MFEDQKTWEGRVFGFQCSVFRNAVIGYLKFRQKSFASS